MRERVAERLPFFLRRQTSKRFPKIILTFSYVHDKIKVQKEKETPQTRKDKIMMKLIWAIPDSIGWAMVGFLCALALAMTIKVVELFIQLWKERREDKE